MKGSIAAAAVIGSVAAAAHNGHAAFHLRGDYATQDVCTVYTTVYVYPSEIPTPVANSTLYVYPTPVESTSSTSCTEEKTSSTPVEVYSTSSTSVYSVYTPPPPPPSSTSEAPKPSKEVYVPVPPASPTSEAPKPSTESYPVTPKPSKSAESKPEGSYSSTGHIVTNGDKWAITYTPYTTEGQCKSASEVQSDIKKIANLGFTTIRSYSTDCGVFENVVPECKKHGLKVIYGIFLEAGGEGGKGPFSTYANNQLQEIIKGADKDSVAMVIVGNEALFNGYCSAETLAKYIVYVREQLQGAGFPKDIAVTTTEPVNIWEEQGAALCSAIDIFTVQVHPYFTSKVEASAAGDFAKEQLEKAAAVCPEAAAKGKYISEIGWPKQGKANGAAVPGYSEQKEAIKSIMEKVGKEACLFSFGDDKWKDAGAYGVEQSFGCSDAIYGN